ncbi:hypothetical protein Tco_0728478 [Tanacetum coccineum]|uniref:Uncharacterized protein n=1 Tax=Tanacetum coccineum TaxID=301880 RepID=A0ABQ4YNX4_9ASTR
MVTIHPSSPSLPTVKIKGLSPIEGRIRQFKKSTMKWQGQMCQIKSSLLITQVQATYDEEKAQRDVGFALNTLSKQAQMSLKRIATLAIRVSSNMIQRL